MHLIKNHLFKHIALSALVLLPLAFVFPLSLKAIFYLTLLIFSIYLLCKKKETRQIYKDKEFRTIALAFGLYLPYSLASIWLQDGPLKAGDNGIHFLFFLCIAVCFGELRSPRIFWNGISAAAFAAGMFAIYQRFGLDIDRPYGMYGINEELGLSAAIKFGMVTAVFSLLALVIALDDRTPIKASCLHACAFLVGFAGCHAIGSRGPWIVMVLVGFGIFILNPPRQYGKTRWLTLLLGLLSVVLVALLFRTKIHHFISSISAELIAIDSGNFNTSLGHRIEMWKAAITMFIANPFFGVGINQFGNHLQQMIASAQAPPFLVHYGQTHNEYFQALATGGIVGLAYLLWLFGAPLIFFIRHLVHRRKIGSDSLVPLGGLVTILAFALFSITDNIFDRQMTTSLFAFLILGFVVMSIDKMAVKNAVLRE